MSRTRRPRISTWARAALMLALVLALPGSSSAQGGMGRIYLPSLWRGVSLPELPVAPTVMATATLAATPTVAASPTATASPTDTPSPTVSPTPTTPPKTGRITGRITVDGKPLEDGYGDIGLPQIELRRGMVIGGALENSNWVTVASAIIQGGDGRYAFQDPPALSGNQVYQVWWLNPPPPIGADLFLDRWRTRAITSFGDGTDHDLGSFDVANLMQLSICNDCLQTAPIEFKWQARDRPSEIYRWALFDGVSMEIDARDQAWLSPSLGRKTSYTTGPPPGFDFDTRYRWYIRIEDPASGGWGWTYYAWRVTWCSSAETCR